MKYDDRATYRTVTDKESLMSQFSVPQFDHPACAETDPEIWHPKEDGKKEARTQLALSICHTCPAKRECLQWALEHKETGIWGGVIESERKALIRKQKRAA